MSARDLQVLDYVREEITNFGRAPTLDEIVARVGGSKTAAHKTVSRLVADGRLRRRPARFRGLSLPDAVDLTSIDTQRLRGELARRGVTMDALAVPRVLHNDGRACAATRCGERVGPGKLMCPRHWFQLPRDLRDNIHQAFNAGASASYQAYVRQAIDLVDGFGGVTFAERGAS